MLRYILDQNGKLVLLCVQRNSRLYCCTPNRWFSAERHKPRHKSVVRAVCWRQHPIPSTRRDQVCSCSKGYAVCFMGISCLVHACLFSDTYFLTVPGDVGRGMNHGRTGPQGPFLGAAPGTTSTLIALVRTPFLVIIRCGVGAVSCDTKYMFYTYRWLRVRPWPQSKITLVGTPPPAPDQAP